MAKLSQDSITQEDIDEFINRDDDFRLEMEVLRRCHELQYETIHAGSYEDPITKKIRQFDIRTFYRHEDFRVYFAIECKNIRENFPLIVSRLPRDITESYHNLLYIQPTRPTDLIQSNTPQKLIVVNPSDLYLVGDFIGKSLAQVGRRANQGNNQGPIVTANEEVYDKWSQALSSAHDQLKSVYGNYRSGSSSYFAFIPILVISDNNLWVADYNKRGTLIKPAYRAEEVEVFLHRNIYTRTNTIAYTFSYLHIYTKSRFLKYLGRLPSNIKYWEMIFPSKVLAHP